MHLCGLTFFRRKSNVWNPVTYTRQKHRHGLRAVGMAQERNRSRGGRAEQTAKGSRHPDAIYEAELLAGLSIRYTIQVVADRNIINSRSTDTLATTPGGRNSVLYQYEVHVASLSFVCCLLRTNRHLDDWLRRDDCSTHRRTLNDVMFLRPATWAGGIQKGCRKMHLYCPAGVLKVVNKVV